MEDQRSKSAGVSVQNILVDADGFVAIVKEDDTNHQKARQYYAHIDTLSVNLITTNYVIAEAITVISQRLSHEVAVNFIDTVTAEPSPITILDIDNTFVLKKAIPLFKGQKSKNVSFVDCINMAVLREHDCLCIFSFDAAYKTNGFTLIEDYLESHNLLSSRS